MQHKISGWNSWRAVQNMTAGQSAFGAVAGHEEFLNGVVARLRTDVEQYVEGVCRFILSEVGRSPLDSSISSVMQTTRFYCECSRRNVFRLANGAAGQIEDLAD